MPTMLTNTGRRAYVGSFPLEGVKVSAYDQSAPPPLEAAPAAGLSLISGVPHLCVVLDITSAKPKKVGKYLMGKILGKGSFGTVRLGQNTVTGMPMG